uniref:Uncharacterized protein n=1 Tax=Oryza meridionalis TaxID=40149 RepID=A0A0E0EWM7_9ORYZ
MAQPPSPPPSTSTRAAPSASCPSLTTRRALPWWSWTSRTPASPSHGRAGASVRCC